MEFVFNHTLNDTSALRDRRPFSAAPDSSYFKQASAEDDLGRSVRQHKPLAKGEHAQSTLVKVFEEDPRMRPRVFVQPTVNKQSFALSSRDVEGAVSRPKDLPRRPRDTDPNAPAYILPGSASPALPLPSDAAAAAAAAAAPPPPPRRAALDVSDINAVDSCVERQRRIATRDTGLRTDDIPGAAPRKPPPGPHQHDPLAVTDISGTHVRRRAASARPDLAPTSRAAGAPSEGGGGGQGGGSGAPYKVVAPWEPLPQQPAQPAAAGGGSYWPPPVAWQPTYTPPPQQPQQPQDAAAAMYAAPAEPLPQQQQQQQPYAPPPYAAGGTAHLPLRPPIPAPPYATIIPGGSLAAALAATLGPMVAHVAAATDLPAATVGKPHPAAHDPARRHAAKRAASDAQRAAAAEAARVMGALRPSRESVEAFWAGCRRLDREVCGKVNPADFALALEKAQVGVGPGEAAALARGLADGSGMVSYRYLARTLMSAVAPPPPPTARAWSASAASASGSGGAAAAKRAGAGAGAAGEASRSASFSGVAAAGGTAPARQLPPPTPAPRLAAAGRSASGRRGVVWAPELGEGAASPVGGSAGGDGGAASASAEPPSPSHAHAYPQQHAPAGGAGTSGTATARFTLGRPTTPPSPSQQQQQQQQQQQPHAPAAAASYSASAPAPEAAPPAAAPPSGATQQHPPPQQPPARAPPPADRPQKRAAGGPEGPVYYEYKGRAYWFGGAAPCAEYTPSADPVASLVGKGAGRLTLPGSGVCLDPDTEAALVARSHRPYSAVSGAEVETRGRSSAGSARQMQLDGPPLYTSPLDVGAGAGSALTAAAGLYAASRPAPSGPRLAGEPLRPASAPRATSARAAVGGHRVGGVALERQMLREEIAAVRGLR